MKKKGKWYNLYTRVKIQLSEITQTFDWENLSSYKKTFRRHWIFQQLAEFCSIECDQPWAIHIYGGINQ